MFGWMMSDLYFESKYLSFMSEYPKAYIDDLGLHLLITKPKINHPWYNEDGTKRTRVEYNKPANCRGRDRDSYICFEITEQEAEEINRYRYMNTHIFPNAPPTACPKPSIVDDVWKYWYEKAYYEYLPKFYNKPRMPNIATFEGVYIPSDIMMKQNQKRFDEYKQQIQHQQNEINKLNEQMKQQNEQIKQLTDTKTKLTNENEILTQKQTVLDREAQHHENVLSLIHETTMNVLKSYGGNWVMNAFNPRRQEEVFDYLYHRYKNISTNDLKKAFDSIHDELSNIDLKPFGE